MSETPRFRTKEALEIALYVDALPRDAREYALDMVYRVIGVPPPRKQSADGKVIELFPRRPEA